MTHINNSSGRFLSENRKHFYIQKLDIVLALLWLHLVPAQSTYKYFPKLNIDLRVAEWKYRLLTRRWFIIQQQLRRALLRAARAHRSHTVASGERESRAIWNIKGRQICLHGEACVCVCVCVWDRCSIWRLWQIALVNSDNGRIIRMPAFESSQSASRTPQAQKAPLTPRAVSCHNKLSISISGHVRLIENGPRAHEIIL